ncbi:MAG TPA: hypothetical protein VHF25_07090 [Nitriliruptorales bacterium]|nr:hypothetical protein [Nitriliruptorales bacterium]
MTVAGRQLDPGRVRPRIPARRTLHDRIPVAWAAGAVIGWTVLVALAIAVEPPASDPQALPSAVETLVGTLVLVGMLGAATAFGARRRAGFLLSLAAGLVLFGASLACPATGHHELAGWWYVQLGATAGLVGGSVYGLRRAPAGD